MSLTGLGEVMDFLKDGLDKFIPDPAQRAQAQLAILQLNQAGAFKELDAQLAAAKAQTDINLAEASNPSMLVSGWRPMVGWVCVAACGWNWIGLPITVAVCKVCHYDIVLVPADITQMLPILTGMLGFASLRTYEKTQGVAAS